MGAHSGPSRRHLLRSAAVLALAALVPRAALAEAPHPAEAPHAALPTSTGPARQAALSALADALADADLPHLANAWLRPALMATRTDGPLPRAAVAAFLIREEALGPDVRPGSPLARWPDLKPPASVASRLRLFRGICLGPTTPADAEGHLDRVRGPRQPEAHLLHAMLAEARRDWRGASALYYQASSAAPPLGEPEVSDATVPAARAQALLGQGRVSLALGQPVAARAYLAPLLDLPGWARPAGLLSALASGRAGALASAVAELDLLLRGGDVVALHAMLAKRDLSPEVQERGWLYGEMRALHGRLVAELDAFLLHRANPAGAVLALDEARRDRRRILPPDVDRGLDRDVWIWNLRRRGAAVEAEGGRLDGEERLGDTALGRACRQRLDWDREGLTDTLGRRILQLVEGSRRELVALGELIPPQDIREEMFSPSFFSW